MITKVIDLSYLYDNDLTLSEILNRILIMLPRYGYHRNTDREFSFTCPDNRTLCIFDPCTKTVECDWNPKAVTQLKATMYYIVEGLVCCKSFLNVWYDVKNPVPCSIVDIVEDKKPDAVPSRVIEKKCSMRTYALSYSESISDIVDAVRANYAQANVCRYVEDTNVVEVTGLNSRRKAVCRFVIDKSTKVLISDNESHINILRDYLNRGLDGHAYYIFN